MQLPVFTELGLSFNPTSHVLVTCGALWARDKAGLCCWPIRGLDFVPCSQISVWFEFQQGKATLP